MIYVIADDLTGATDTGVQLSKQGYNTVVSIADNLEKMDELEVENGKIDVLVIDSESRDLSSIKAQKRMRKILNNLSLKKTDIIYKKIDSTLRGNIGIEINEIMNKFELDICILAPSFPSNNRIVTGGYLLVRNQPLGMSKYYRGELDSGEASYIPSLLNEESELSVERIDLKEVMKGPDNLFTHLKDLFKNGKKIILFDAVTDQHLKNIFKGSIKFEGSVLYSGSAGLAGYLSQLDYSYKSDKCKFELENREDPFLIVVGTRRKIMEAQINYFKDRVNVLELNIDIKKLYKDKNKFINMYLNQIEKAFSDNNHMILRPIPIETSAIKELSSRELEVVIRDLLGEITSRIINSISIRNLVLTGGDTAVGVCKSLGIYKLKILYELLPGIPVSRDMENRYDHLNIITKAGGFGNNNTLYKLLKKYQNSEVRG